MIVQNLWYNLEVPELFLPACSDVPDHLPPGLKITRQGVKQSSNDHAQVTILWTTKSRSKCVNKPMLANDIFKKNNGRNARERTSPLSKTGNPKPLLVATNSVAIHCLIEPVHE
jgi:hypothetical protein